VIQMTSVVASNILSGRSSSQLARASAREHRVNQIYQTGDDLDATRVTPVGSARA
jgi:hypothetical protein